MFSTHRRAAVVAWLGVGLCVSLAGCRKEPPAEPNKPAVPKIPVRKPEKKREAPAIPATKPGVSKDRTPGVSPPAGAIKPTPKPGPPPTSAPRPAGVDAGDAADAPVFFPRSKAVADWMKDEPIRTALAGASGELLGTKARAVTEPYRVKQVATCTYKRSEKERQQTARVLLVQTHGTEDAYGIFTVQATGTLSKGPGLLTRTDAKGGQVTIHAWKGRCYLQLTSGTSDDSASAQACKALVDKMTFLMPDEPLPELVEALPQAGLIPGQHWLIRDWGSLGGPGVTGLKIPKGQQIAKLLRLSKDCQMVIATYRIEGAARPHLVWVVRYDTPAQARQAHNGYQGYLDEGTDRWSSSTMLYAPNKQYLLGTWTAEEESFGQVLRKLESNLP